MSGIGNILFGKPGPRFHELSRFHRATRYLYVYLHVKLTRGESWREYKERWVRI